MEYGKMSYKMMIFTIISTSRFNQLKKNPQESSLIHKSGKSDPLGKEIHDCFCRTYCTKFQAVATKEIKLKRLK